MLDRLRAAGYYCWLGLLCLLAGHERVWEAVAEAVRECERRDYSDDEG